MFVNAGKWVNGGPTLYFFCMLKIFQYKKYQKKNHNVCHNSGRKITVYQCPPCLKLEKIEKKMKVPNRSTIFNKPGYTQFLFILRGSGIGV